MNVFELMMEYIKEGRVKIDREKFAGKLTTVHDPCNYGRKSEKAFGHGYYDEIRWVVDQICDTWVDTYSSRENNFCCGAGGGAGGGNWPGPFEKESAYQDRKKYESIKNSGANVVVMGCSNCHDQIMKRLTKYYDCDYEVKYIWQLVADSLVLEPWSEEEAAKGEAEAAAQWERLDVDLEAGYE